MPPSSEIYTSVIDFKYIAKELFTTANRPFSQTALSLILSGLFTFPVTAVAEDVPVNDVGDFQTTVRSDTNYLIQSDLSTDNLSFTVYNGIDLALIGSKEDGSPVVIQATDTPDGALLDLDVYNSNIRLEGLDLRGGTGTQSALLFNTASFHYEKTLTLNMSDFSVTDFTAGDEAVILTDPNRGSGNTEPMWFDRLSMRNVTLAGNSGSSILNFGLGANIATLSTLVLQGNTATGSAFYLDLAGGTINEFTATGNTVGNYVASFAYNRYLPTSATADELGGALSITGASFTGVG